MARIEDEDFILGGQGLAVEFCIFCTALRVRVIFLLPYSFYFHVIENEITLLKCG